MFDYIIKESDTIFNVAIGISFGLLLPWLTKFILNVSLHLQKINPKIMGEILSDIGIGLFVNSTFLLSIGDEKTNYVSVIVMLFSSIILIITGSTMKWRK